MADDDMKSIPPVDDEEEVKTSVETIDAKRAEAERKKAESEHHGFAHVTPLKLLFGVLGILLVLTVATVAVTSIDLGSQWNLVVAMVIATIKAGLVVTFFMHLLWDKRFHLLVFLSSVLFLILFLGLAIADHKEYQHDIDAKEADMKAQAQK